MFWLMLTIAAFVLLVLALLILPAGMAFERRAGESRRWLILAGVRMPARKRKTGEGIELRQTRQAEQKPGVAERMQRIPELARLLLRETDIRDIETAAHALRRFGKSVHVRVHHLDLLVATPDYALTGALYGFACAGLGSVNWRVPVFCAPDFTQERPDACYRVDVAVRPLRVIWPAALAAWRLVLCKPGRARRAYSLWRRKQLS